MSTHRRRPAQQRLTAFRIIRFTLWHRRNLLFHEACRLLGLKPLFKQVGSTSKADLAPMADKAHINETAFLAEHPNCRINASNRRVFVANKHIFAPHRCNGMTERMSLSSKSTTFRDARRTRQMFIQATAPSTRSQMTLLDNSANR